MLLGVTVLRMEAGTCKQGMGDKKVLRPPTGMQGTAVHSWLSDMNICVCVFLSFIC